MKMKIVNVTPHPINFRHEDGTEFEVSPSGVMLSATPKEVEVGTHSAGPRLVRVQFVSNPEGEAALSKIESENPEAIVVGSMFAAQAFPGRVVAMVAARGYERRPSAEKRMDPTKFTTF